MALRYTDSHCHADFAALAARAAEISEMSVCVDACFEREWAGLSKFDMYPVKKAYGLHPDLRLSNPGDAGGAEGELKSKLAALEAFLPGADAVGETGLDAGVGRRIPMELQRSAFLAQLGLADKYRLPVVVHCVGAWGEVFEILRGWRAASAASGRSGGKFMLHAASCSPEMVGRFCGLGARFSFGARELLSKRGARAAAAAPREAILVESDSVPSRGEIGKIFELLAKIRGESAQGLSEAAFENYSEFFR